MNSGCARAADNAVDPIPAVGPSFRDPAGSVVLIDDRVFRFVNQQGIPELNAFLSSRSARILQESGQIIQSRVMDAGEAGELLRRVSSRFREVPHGPMVLEHPKIAFPSFPYEWSPEMLHAAATLSIELCRALWDEGMGLKDATPYNVLFEGPNPLFVDLLSFERRDSHEITWLAYGQFVRTFLLPLAMNKLCGTRIDSIFLTRRDGLEPEEVYSQLAWPKKLRPPFLTLATMPAWLGARSQSDDVMAARRRVASEDKAHFIVGSLLSRTRRLLSRLEPQVESTSKWSAYQECNSYSAEGLRCKQDFVEEALREFRPRRLLDVGANRGLYSEIAAKLGSAVVAIDSDPVVSGRLWRRARSQGLNILPLVVNLARPSPAVGWRCRESPSFLERSQDHFDAVLMLAVVHHLLVTDGIPLDEILQVSAELTRDLLLIEFVPQDDPMFRQLARGREGLHADLTQTTFEEACQKYYRIVRSQPIPIEETKRRLYLLRKR